VRLQQYYNKISQYSFTYLLTFIPESTASICTPNNCQYMHTNQLPVYAHQSTASIDTPINCQYMHTNQLPVYAHQFNDTFQPFCSLRYTSTVKLTTD